MSLRIIDLVAAPDDPSSLAALARLLDRTTTTAAHVESAVAEILAAVRARGDEAVRAYTERFDRRSPGSEASDSRYEPGSYEIRRAVWHAAADAVSPVVQRALETAAERIRAFHERQREEDYVLEVGGARLELRVQPMQRAGLYVPGGTARYPSSVLMTAIPARVAGVAEIVMVTPGASAETLAAARLAGVDRVFEIGGAQAVAALAYGTQTVPRVDTIVGPGNQWVAAAKRMVYGEVDIDSVAGPSEVLIIADETAEPAWVAADLLAQAEHDVEARPILVTTSAALVPAVNAQLERQLAGLSRRDIAAASLAAHGVAIVVASRAAAIELANRYAPEHLELHIRDPRAAVPVLRTAGAIFVGPWAVEAAGDYVAGPNHVLPTGGAARYASPLGVHDFRKRTSILEYSRETLAAQVEEIVALATVEGLDAHGRSAAIRFDGTVPSGKSDGGKEGGS
jgi:histidinol dehydrogenase